MNHSHSKPVVSSQLDYSKIKQTIAATVQEQSFLPIGNSDFSYSGTQEIVIKLATATDGAFADMKHSYLRMKVNNPNAYDIFFDGLASSIIQDFTVSINGISAETIQDYNVLMNSLMAHFGSASFSKELAITSGAPNAPLSSGAFDISSTAGTNYGTQIIKAGSSTIVSIPVVSAFLQSRLMPLMFLANSFCEIKLRLADPRVAFLANNSVSDALAQSCNYTVNNVEFITQVISIKDRETIDKLGSMLMSDGLYINGKTWTRYKNYVPTSETAPSITINDHSQSCCGVWNVQTLQQPDVRVSNLSGGVWGNTSFRINMGSQYFPYNRAIEYNTNNNGSFLNSYLNLQKFCSTGFYSTNNICDVNYNSFSQQSPNSVYDFSTQGQNSIATAYAVGATARNKIIPSSFVNAYSFESFSSMSGVENGVNLATLNLPLILQFTRDANTYKGLNLFKYVDGSASDGSDGIPSLVNLCYVQSDVIWKISSNGTLEVLR